MSTTVAPSGGERIQSSYELEPDVYMGVIREFLQENGSYAIRNPITYEVGEQAKAQEFPSRTFVAEEYADRGEGSVSPEELEWISDGFSTVMTRLAKVSAKAAHENADLTSFLEMDQEGKDTLRRHVFGEFLELSAMFVKEAGSPSKSTYQLSPVLYHGPEAVQRLAADNDDLGPYYVFRAIRRRPHGVEVFLEEAREEVERAVQKFPTIPRAEICAQVLYTPANYEKNLRRYAERKGIRLEVDEQPALLDTGSFLQTLRELVRSRQYDLGRLRPQTELIETADKFGQEALAIVDESGTALDDKLKDIFQKRIELLTIVADKAWRRGDLDVSLKHSPEEFRRALYTRALGDFVTIHASVNGHAEAGQLTSLYDPAEVQEITSAHADLPAWVLVHMLLRHPEGVEEAIDEFRTRVHKVEEEHPRLTQTHALRMALWNSDAVAEIETPEAAEKRTPQESLEDMRTYLQTHANVINAFTKKSRAEFAQRLPELEGFFESVGWTFADVELPPEVQSALVKKMEEFITAIECAYREGGISTRLGDFSPEERLELYGEFAEDYAHMVNLLGMNRTTVQKKAPVLYMTANELVDLKSEYSWMRDGDFRTVAIKNPNSVAATLGRILESRSALKLTYPGLSDAFIKEISAKSPVTAPKKAIARIRKASEWEFGRASDFVIEPTGRDTRKLYKHLRTLAKHNRTPQFNSFDQETEERIAEFRSEALALISEQPGSDNIESEQLDKILTHMEHYIRISETLHREDSYPSLLDLDVKARGFFARYVYDNQVELNRLTETQGNGSWKFRTHNFGFFHDASYLPKLWNRYEAYMPPRLITFAALMSPRRPIDRLNNIVEYRAGLLRDNPDLSAADLHKATLAKLQELA